MDKLVYILGELSKLPNNHILTVNDLKVLIENSLLNEDDELNNEEKERISNYDNLDHH